MHKLTSIATAIFSTILIINLHNSYAYQLQAEVKRESWPVQTNQHQQSSSLAFNQQHKPTPFGSTQHHYQQQQHHVAAPMQPWRSHGVMPPNNDQVLANSQQHQQQPVTTNTANAHPTLAAASNNNWQQIQFDSPGPNNNLSSGRVQQQQQLEAHATNQLPKNNHNQQIYLDEQSTVSNSFLSGNLEFALRQASGDESVFQPASTIGAPSHDPDWYHGHESGGTVGSANANNDHPFGRQLNASTDVSRTTTTTTTTTTSTTPLTPIIVEANENHADLHSEPPRSISINQHQKEYQTNSNQAIEINNQVFYDGPVTAPPVGDYYFSSSENLPNHNVRTSNAWW